MFRYFKKKPKKEECVVWTPQKDITTWELAQLTPWFTNRISAQIAMSFPPELKRHLTIK